VSAFPAYSRPALTLIEVLAATVLLALVAGTCASLIRAATGQLAGGPAGPPISELAGLADRWLDPANQDGPSPMSEWLRSGQDDLDIPWPGDPAHPGVHLHLLRSTGGDAARTWIELECSGTRVWRWMPVEPTRTGPDR
jgi:hypothetical protein